MNTAGDWPPLVNAFAWALACGSLLHAIGGVRWRALDGQRETQRLLLLCFIALVLLREVNTHAVRGVLLSFLGSAIATLMFGPRLALALLAVVSAVAAATGVAWQHWAADFVVSGVVPVLVAAGMLQFTQRRLPAHIFIYVIVNGFFAGGLSMAASDLLKAASVALWGGGWSEAYLVATLPMTFGEGFLTGGAAALMVAYRPHWLATFDDAKYLAKRD